MVCYELEQSLLIKTIVAIKLKDIEDSLIYQYGIPRYDYFKNPLQRSLKMISPETQ